MSRPLVAVVSLAVLVPLGLAGCGREAAFPDRVARVTVDGRATTYTIDSCGLDGVTAFVVGRSDEGAVVQAVIGVEADGETGVPASTGITIIDFDEGSWSAFGDEAWERRGKTTESPGDIDSARIRGARVQAGGEAVPVDADEQPTGGPAVPISFDARCDADDQG